MSLAAESVTFPGSNLVFQNTYGAGVSDAYRAAIVTAENAFQSQFGNSLTVSMSFDLKPLDASFSAHNQYALVGASYAEFAAALAANATTAADHAAVASLPTTDPSSGVGFWLPSAEARALGLASSSSGIDDTITLNSNLPFTFGADAVGVLEHEISEGVFGRVGSLGLQQAGWQPMDLFRFNAQGQRDYTGGADGQATFFGVDGAHLTSLQYHNAIGPNGANDGFDLADWGQTSGDAFGPVAPGNAGSLSATDLQVLDVLGWTPNSVGASQAAAVGSSPNGGLPAGSLSDITVATLSYEFFTGKTPTAAGMTYLVSPAGPNPNNLSSAYYQSFSLENRYINFAVNLGKAGAGEADFNAKYGDLSLFDATKLTYATIFGAAPSDAKVHALLDPITVWDGQSLSRADYFALYGGDGADGIGTKAAMVGWLLAEADKADVGAYALANDVFLADVTLHNAPFGVDLVGVYAQPSFAYHAG
ncbi:MAG TPA: NF038122 family metalloprotease [Phenylobacterium sp.]|jgi:hypothetical protein|nr:NF038122 family metalloprotease [Phenylobacterium sp.]